MAIDGNIIIRIVKTIDNTRFNISIIQSIRSEIKTVIT